LSLSTNGDYLGNPSGKALSQSLPLAKKRFNRKESRPFFAGVLPEESNRETIARNLASARRMILPCWNKSAGVRGAVTFLPKGTPYPTAKTPTGIERSGTGRHSPLIAQAPAAGGRSGHPVVPGRGTGQDCGEGEGENN